MSSAISQLLGIQTTSGLYKPAGGAGASFCIISNMLHIRDPFFKIKASRLKVTLIILTKILLITPSET